MAWLLDDILKHEVSGIEVCELIHYFTRSFSGLLPVLYHLQAKNVFHASKRLTKKK